MKAVILAGGLGTRISEETHLRPKPMIEIGGKPILWHIMKLYSAHGFNERGHTIGHCDLCGHFSGTAGSPAQATLISKPVLAVRVAPERPEIIRCARRRVGAHLPRAPPVPFELI